MTKRKTLYGATIALGSFLLFSVEPMAAKQLLPELGGSSAVWLTCLFFFQTMLLAAYGYVFWALRGRRMGGLHLALLAAALLSLALPGHGAVAETVRYPATTIFLTLLRSIGLPFFLLGTTAPLLQAWFARRERLPESLDAGGASQGAPCSGGDAGPRAGRRERDPRARR